eukprot:gene29243-36260_t
MEKRLNILREQNSKLRELIVEQLPKTGPQIIARCTSPSSDLLMNMTQSDDKGIKLHNSAHIFHVSPLTNKKSLGSDEALVTQNETAAKQQLSSQEVASALQSEIKALVLPDHQLMNSLTQSQANFLITDPSLPDNPIVYASDGFCNLTGYKRSDVLGRNCRFLQGPGTDPIANELIREGLRSHNDVTVCLLNYKADGTPFWNQFYLASLKDREGKIVNFMGVQCDAGVVPVREMKDIVEKVKLNAE